MELRNFSLVATAICVAALPVAGLAFDAEYTASQMVTISQAGSYLVTGGIFEAWVNRTDASCFGIARNVAQEATVPAGAGLFVTGGTVKRNHLIVVATDNEGIPCTGGRLSPAAENTAREDTRPPASDTRINPVRHNSMDETDFAYSFANCNVGCSSGAERKLAGLWLSMDAGLTSLFPAGVNFEKAPGAAAYASHISRKVPRSAGAGEKFST